MDLNNLLPNQIIGLAGDADFRGYFYGPTNPDPTLGEVAVVYVKERGQSGRKQGSVTLFPASALTKVERVMR